MPTGISSVPLVISPLRFNQTTPHTPIATNNPTKSGSKGPGGAGSTTSFIISANRTSASVIAAHPSDFLALPKIDE
jgi:hypothetical protein